MYPSTGEFTTKEQLEEWIVAGGLKPIIRTDPAMRKLIDLIGEKVSVCPFFYVDIIYILSFFNRKSYIVF